jgi:transcriptional regulator of acetoin/glycerol metabolism
MNFMTIAFLAIGARGRKPRAKMSLFGNRNPAKGINTRRTEAARLLGISRRTMQRKLKEMGLIEE